MTAAEQKGADVLLRVRVQPRASRDAIMRESDGRLRVALTAPPVDGAANAALTAFLSKHLHVAKSRVALEHGEKSRDKVVRIHSMTLDEIKERLGVDRDGA